MTNTDDAFVCDYIFICGLLVVAKASLEPDQVDEYALKLARSQRAPIKVCLVVGIMEPDACQVCGCLLPQDGLCPCSDLIPFEGEPMKPKNITESDEYF